MTFSGSYRYRFGDVVLGVLLVLVLVFGTVLVKAAGRGGETGWHENRTLVHVLRLTDLCLFTEARYTRHPSQADLHTPFQDHPMAQEHFPSGTLLGPPQKGPADAPVDR